MFLEGIEVPVIGAQIQTNLDAPATAAIQVIPTDKVMDLKARTMVHLFYADFNDDLSDPPTGEEVSEPKDPVLGPSGYKLLFGGEVVGIVIGKSPIGRQAVLQCADWSSYWDSMYQIFLNSGRNSQYSGDEVQEYGGGSQTIDNVLSSPKDINSYLEKSPKSPGLQNVKGLMGGVISLIEAMGGSPKVNSGVNDFFTIAELKNHLLQQIVCEQDDNTAQRLFNSKAFSSWLKGRTSSLGGMVNLRTIIRLLFQWIYYETVPVTCPMYVPPKAEKPYIKKRGARPGRSYVNREQKIIIKQQIEISEKFDGKLSKNKRILNQLKADHLKLNKEMIKKLDSLLRLKTIRTVSKWDEKTSKYVDKTVEYEGGGGDIPPVSTGRDFNSGRTWAFASEPSLYTGVLSPEARVHIEKAKKHLENMVSLVTAGISERSSLYSFLFGAGAVNLLWSDPGNDVDPDVVSKRNELLHILDSNMKQWKRVSIELYRALGIGGRTASEKLINDSEVDRLYTQVFRPDCFFVSPPKCNVLFPEQYTQFQFQRNFLQEITRLRLTTGLKFNNVTKGNFTQNAYFAPSKKDILSIARDLGTKGFRTVLPWEMYSGVLPKFEHIAHMEDTKTKKERELRKGIEVKSYIQRAANFNFFKYRFAPRVLSVAGRFTPQFAPGFPALLITEPFIVDPSAIASALENAGIEGYANLDISSFIGDVGTLSAFFKAPLHYLGMPAVMSHSVGQEGGSTNITLTHARSHRTEDDDFLKLFEAQSVKKLMTKIVRTDLDAEQLLQDGDYKKIRFLIDCTNQEATYDRNHSLFLGKEPEENPQDLLELDRRPTGAPKFATISQISPMVFKNREAGTFMGSGNSRPNDFRDRLEAIADAQVVDRSHQGNYFLTGEVSRNPLTYAPSTTILEPFPYGKIQRGSKGLNPRGKVLQIQVLSNQIMAVRKEDINKFAKSNKDRKAIKKASKGNAKSKYFFMWRSAVVHEEVDLRRYEQKYKAVYQSLVDPRYRSMGLEGTNLVQPFGGTLRLGGGLNTDRSASALLSQRKTTTGFDASLKASRDRINSNSLDNMAKGVRTYRKAGRVGYAGKVYSPIPIEESIRPSWFSPLYSNFFIGEFIYQKFFGTGALVDQAMFMSPTGDTLFGTKGDRDELIAQVRAADGDPVKITQILNDAKGSSLSEIPGIEQSADSLAYIYGEVRRQNMDVQGFISDYTGRPIATMTDIFGSSDLEYKENGNQLDIETGSGGFHSTAVAPFGELLGLIDNPDLELARLDTRGRKYPVSKELDPRPGRRAAVEAYAEEVSSSGGSLAVGLRG